jgi:hypothetical protein
VLLLFAPDVAAQPALRESSAARLPSWLLSLLLRVSLA